jgi:holo-ACP synthase CitX
MQRLKDRLAELEKPVFHTETRITADGPEGHLVSSASGRKLKLLCVAIENANPLGRLLDIDIMEPGGRQISRSELGLPHRKCLICEAPAMECIRGGAHDLNQVHSRVLELLR